FADKDELVAAVLVWVEQTWFDEVGQLLSAATDPVEALVGVARAHAVYCRRDVARVVTALRVEFSGRDHAIGKAIDETLARVAGECTRLIRAGRRIGQIPLGPPASILGAGLLGALEGLAINVAGKAPSDEILAERVVRGLL